MTPRQSERLGVDILQRQLQATTGRDIRLIETHISWVLLDGEYAWKIKKPVTLGFVDFSQLDARRQACEDELRLNQRLAPGIYLNVVPVRGMSKMPHVQGEDVVIDYALQMKQFPDGALLSELLGTGKLDVVTIDRLAATLAAFHRQCAHASMDTTYGTSESIRGATLRVLDALSTGVREARITSLAAWCHSEEGRLHPYFLERKRQGWVREGHGDLHLDNLIALDTAVTAFDCVEFDPMLRWIDVQSDIAFLTMDLRANGRPDLAFRFLDRWLEITGDYSGLNVHRYYAVYRALVRALVAVIRSTERLDRGHIDYLAVATTLSAPGAPRLLITHGPAGSGKSFITQRLLETAGAIRLRSDVERKRLLGLSALDTTTSLGERTAYSSETTQRTYAQLHATAAAVLGAGYPVIVDAAFLTSIERREFKKLAQAMELPFTILHCHAPFDVLQSRVIARHSRADDASEADLSVLERQCREGDPLTEEEHATCISIDTTRSVDVAAVSSRWLAV